MTHTKLDSLEIFATIVRCKGFRAAALERGISSSALSQSMSALEASLGIRLLNRTTRSVAPTEAGQLLLDTLGPALRDIHRALDGLDQLRDSPAGTLRFNAPGPAVDHVLGPMVYDFMRAHPKVKVEIVADAAIVDIVEQGFDAGVRFGKQLAQDMIAVPLGPPLRYVIVASPEYLRQRGAVQVPDDLADHEAILRRFPGGTLVSWSFEKDGRSLTIQPQGRLTVSSAHQELQAALAGQGVAHLFEDYVREPLRDGRLVALLADWSPQLPSWYLYYPHRSHASAAMKAFLEHVRSYV